MNVVKIIGGVVLVLAVLLGIQLYYQSKYPNPYLWDETDLTEALTSLGATDVTVSEQNVITIKLAEGRELFGQFTGEATLIPGALLDDIFEAPEGETLKPMIREDADGNLLLIFSDGSQQQLRTPAQQRLNNVLKATRQLTLQLINGVTLGGVYAMIAVGYTLVYGILFMINFAHGEFFMFGSYGAFFALSWMTRSNGLPFPLAAVLLLAMVIAMIVSSLLSVIIERAAYRPLRQAPRLTLLISAIGASIFLQNVMMLITQGRIKYYPNDVLVKGSIPLIGGIALEKIGLLIIVISIAMMAALYTIIQKTKTGKAIRAVAEDKETASLMGINVNRIVVTTFLLGSSMAGAGGLMVGLRDTQINHMMGFLPGMKAFTAAVLGGIGNIPGAMFGGYFLGIAEALGTQFMPAEYKDVIAFSLLVLVLIVRPTGFMGEILATKKM